LARGGEPLNFFMIENHFEMSVEHIANVQRMRAVQKTVLNNAEPDRRDQQLRVFD
jgi:hypothetical protein